MRQPTYTREHLLETWEVYGTGTPLTEEQIDFLLALMNRPLASGGIVPNTEYSLRPDFGIIPGLF
jgi:hypothetical protein